MLQGHSSFKPQNFVEETGVQLTETNVFLKLLNIDRKAALDYMLGNESLCQDFFDQASSIQSFWKKIFGRRKIKRALSFSDTLRRIAWMVQRNDLFVQSFFDFAQKARGMERILEKTPTEIFILPEVKATYPQAKLLYVCRHPIDVYSSYKKRKEITMKLDSSMNANWLEISVENFCGMYLKSVNLARREKKINSDHFMIMKYEDLVKEPMQSMISVCEFLDEIFEEGTIPMDKSASSDWKVDPHLFGVVRKKTKNWETYATAFEAKIIEDRLAPLMLELGYTNYT
jgi:hypothetical protein